MAKKVSIRGLRQTKLLRGTSKRYKAKYGRRPSDKQIAYWGRGWAKKAKREIIIVEEKLYRHTVAWGFGYIDNQRKEGDRHVWYAAEPMTRAQAIGKALKDREEDIPYRNKGFGWGQRVKMSYAVESE